MHPIIAEELVRLSIEDRLAAARRVHVARKRSLAAHRLRRVLAFALIRWGTKLAGGAAQMPAPTPGRL